MISNNQDQGGPISEQLDELTCDAIGMALDKLAMGEGIWPTLVLLHEDGERDCYVFEDDGLDICLMEARESVKKLGEQSVCYALFYDGFFENADGLSDNAIVVEFGDRGAETAYSALVAYGNPGMEDDFWYDAPIAGGEERLLF